jgi:hypothetical protein
VNYIECMSNKKIKTSIAKNDYKCPWKDPRRFPRVELVFLLTIQQLVG